MNTALSLFISTGIAAFGVWIIADIIAAEARLAWTLMGLLPVMVGSISFCQEIRSFKLS